MTATTTIQTEVARRKWQRLPQPRMSFADDMADAVERLVARTTHVQFPNPKYAADPVAFFREVLGVEPWDRQIELIEAVRDNDRVAVCSGHKVSKSNSAAGIALWFYCSFAAARVVLTSATSRQVDQILWRELRMLRARSGTCLECKRADPQGKTIKRPCPHSAIIEGAEGELARTGLKAPDFREIVGFTAREAEAVAGISGPSLLYIADEASGIEDLIFEAIDGNRAGGARLLMLSQGTRNSGTFFDAFNSKAKFYKTMRISSADTPNYRARKILIPGLATYDWVEEKREEWGEDSPLFKVRVEGQHAVFEDSKIFSVHMIGEAEQRWSEMPAEGRLFVGVDPAGESGLNDETAMCVRRGRKPLALRVHLGLNEDQILGVLLGVLLEFKTRGEKPVVVIDRDGAIGVKLYRRALEHLEERPHDFELVAVRSSDRAIREPAIYDRIRDELAANLRDWIRDGGALIEDAKLARELHTLEFRQQVNGRVKLISKDEIRKHIGRSPDRYDALALSVWEPLALTDPALAAKVAPQPSSKPDPATRTFDPYAGLDPYRR